MGQIENSEPDKTFEHSVTVAPLGSALGNLVPALLASMVLSTSLLYSMLILTWILEAYNDLLLLCELSLKNWLTGNPSPI
jgi:hypothetical protein